MQHETMMSRREMIRGGLASGLRQAIGAASAVAGAAGLAGAAVAGPEKPTRAPQAVPVPKDPTPPPGADAQPAMRLPELHQSFLDDATLAALFRDIEACTQVLEVIPKQASAAMVGEQSVTLDEGQRLLLGRQVRGLQIRYVYDGAQWWDTLIQTPSGVRVVRIRHDVDQMGRPEAAPL